jgi:hypothetical protein
MVERYLVKYLLTNGVQSSTAYHQLEDAIKLANKFETISTVEEYSITDLALDRKMSCPRPMDYLKWKFSKKVTHSKSSLTHSKSSITHSKKSSITNSVDSLDNGEELPEKLLALRNKTHLEILACNEFSVSLKLPESIGELLIAHSDKAYQYEYIGDEFDLEFYQLLMVYLLSYVEPYSQTVRQTSDGWIPVEDWLRQMIVKPEIQKALKDSKITHR